jgi:hypothetical protein
VTAGAVRLRMIAVTERPDGVNEALLPLSGARAGAHFWSLAEWARGRSMTSGNCRQD